MLRNNSDARQCSYFELGLPVVHFGHNDLVSNGRACYMFLAYMYTGVELFYVSGCLAGYQLE